MKLIGTARLTELKQWLRMAESLRNCPDWGEEDLPIEIIRTHISMILLGKRRVLKLKKPIDLGFLDYTTLQKRLESCKAEVELNSRLCPGYYLGVQAISRIDGELRFSDHGPVVEYGVIMKRLPTDQMLDRLVARGEVAEVTIQRIADRLVEFHRTARRGPEIDVFGSPEVIARNWQENFDQTAPYIDRSIAAETHRSIRDWVTRWLEEHQEFLRTRVNERRICDGHGDIRAESICVTNGLCIFDCIEFNERFRCSDLANEVAFLAMDLDARGRPDLGYHFVEQYGLRSKDEGLFKLLQFYRCYRAYVRGKVQSFRLDDVDLTALEREVAAVRARRYFDLALRYSSPLHKPYVIVVSGLAGSGKTSLARAIGGELCLRVVSSDTVRKTLFGITEGFGYGVGPYSSDANRLTYKTMIELGRDLVVQNRGVVLDATFKRKEDRAIAREMALRGGAEWRVIDCYLPPQLVHERLEQRAKLNDGLSDATWETYLRQRRDFELFDDADGPRCEVDTSANLGVVARRVTDWLRANDRGV